MMKKQIIFIFLLFQIHFLRAQNPVNALFTGEKDGECIRYYSNGSIRDQLTIKNGKIQGDRYCFYENGKLMVKEQFDNGEYHGTNYMQNQNGDVIYIEIYKHDTLLFTENYYYFFNGKLKSKSTVKYQSDSTLKKNTFSKTKYANGGVYVYLKPVQESVNNMEIYKKLFRSGQTKIYWEIEQYNGMSSGKFFKYYHSGKIKVIRHYKDHKANGEWLKYKKDGLLIEKKIYKDGAT